MWFRLRNYDVYLRWIIFSVHIQNTKKGRGTSRRPFLRILLSFSFAAFFEFIHTDANTSTSNVQQIFFFFSSTGITETLGSQVIFILLFPKS